VVPGRLLHPFHLEKSAQLAGLMSRRMMLLRGLLEHTVWFAVAITETWPAGSTLARPWLAIHLLCGGGHNPGKRPKPTRKLETSTEAIQRTCGQWPLLQLESRENASLFLAATFPPVQLVPNLGAHREKD